ncbi:hypothetical protein D3C80_2115060 [compost metagenome]
MRDIIEAETADLRHIIIEQEDECCDDGRPQKGTTDAWFCRSAGHRAQSHFVFFSLRAQANRQQREQRRPPDDEVNRDS